MKSFVSALILSAVSAVANHFFRFYANKTNSEIIDNQLSRRLRWLQDIRWD